MRLELWDLLGGFDERFDLQVAVLVNLDTYARAIELPDVKRVLLIGEGTFHQLHGGIATNTPPEQTRTTGRDGRANTRKSAAVPMPFPIRDSRPRMLEPCRARLSFI